MSMNIHQQRILILDFGSQYTQLIARRVRELGVYCELHAFDMSPEAIQKFNPQGIILSGGPQSVTGETTPRAPEIIFELGCPILGICYGMQTLTAQLGGQVYNAEKREFGYAQVSITHSSPLLDGIEDRFEDNQAQLDVWMSHGDQVIQLPPDFITIGGSENAPHAAIMNAQRHYYGLQFHPEVTHTRQGSAILGRFIHEICGCASLWTPDNIIDDSIATVREKVGQDHVLLALSGGVDSSVVAALLHRAIAKQLTCIFVDTGLLRLNEGDQVMAMFAQHMGVNVIRVDAREQFYDALKGVTDPEVKRNKIGLTFIKIFEQEAEKLTNVKWLAQGTIYPDVIESAGSKTGKAQVIKSHHNVGGLPEKMQLKLIEPLRELFKDEVRKIGINLGLPHNMVYRHPFPGPGLGVRILGEVKPEYAEILRQADAIFIETLHKRDYYHKVSQAFAVFLPVKSVGVTGDQRTYDYVIALRAVETVDFMTATWAELPHDLLAEASNRIINEIPGISRVVYDISGKPPATIEWE